MLLSMAQPKSHALTLPAPVPADETGTVLLVEDEPAIARMLTRLFAQAGLPVVAAADATAGMSALERNQRDIVLALVDCHAVGFQSRDFCHRVRAVLPGLPMVVAGSRDPLATTGEAAEGGLTVFVPRPYLPTELVWKVRSMLGRALA